MGLFPDCSGGLRGPPEIFGASGWGFRAPLGSGFRAPGPPKPPGALRGPPGVWPVAPRTTAPSLRRSKLPALVKERGPLGGAPAPAPGCSSRWKRVGTALAGLGGNLGFRVQGLGFRVQGLGFRVSGLGFGVQGLGFRVQGLGFRV